MFVLGQGFNGGKGAVHDCVYRGPSVEPHRTAEDAGAETRRTSDFAQSWSL